MGKTLYIAEKQSVGRLIARALGGGTAKSGYVEGENSVFSWCQGHLVQLADSTAYDERYARWDIADLPLLPEKWKYVVRDDTRPQFDILKRLMHRRDVDYVVNACDAGREGELIFRLVYGMAKCKKPVKRLWVSSMEEDAIRRAAADAAPGEAYDNLYRAAACRQKADWSVGINATRLFSVKYGTLLNVGRVVAPTLSIVTERQEQIDRFVPAPYWKAYIMIGSAKATTERIDSERYASQLAAFCESATAEVIEVTSHKRSRNPPRLFDLTSLQREANRLFGFTARQTLQTAQKLYEKKLLTYPRTDSRFLTADMQGVALQLISQIQKKWPHLTNSQTQVDRVLDSSKVSDHYAIVPTAKVTGVDLSVLPSDERRVLELVSSRLITACGAPHTYVDTTVTIKCTRNGKTAPDLFRMHGTVTVNPGWKADEDAALSYMGARPEKETASEAEEPGIPQLPPLRKGDQFQHPEAGVEKLMTKPPVHYTDGTLLAAMERAGKQEVTEEAERRGLGTPATRDQIIEKLIRNGMLLRKGRKLIPTKEAITFTSLLPPELVSPSMTAEWENRLARIADGTENASDFMDDIESYVQKLIVENSAPSDLKVMLRAPNDRPHTGKRLGKCPRCGGDVAENKAGWGCTNPACKFMMFRDDKFFKWKKKRFTKKIARELLVKGRAFVKDLYSEKKNAHYDAYVVLNDDGEGYVRYAIELCANSKQRGE